ncbi:DUF6141 family protein [Pontibacter sp. E15-1]|uniref:DUF6141 family protein n=1 Tax=Pontibacter sp. E15-1 TaxID=2919918 RepID=UPI001F4F3FD0|nr:DUF6141 family protein [Pontibacter sp. E15-1]MCJ8164109.1 DUF6141 family protein [Pontibacter sp. E15-1]
MEEQYVYFREKQRFRQPWLWVVVLGVAGLFWAGFISQVLFGAVFGSRPIADVQLTVAFVLVGIGLPWFFYKMSLTTEVRPGELQVRFWPFHHKPVIIPLHTIRNYIHVTYNPILEYGGWGMRWGLQGKAYNTSGTKGVKLEFYNQRPLLIGSQRAEELWEAIRLAKEGNS